MFTIFFCSIFLLAATDSVHGKYQRVSHGWISRHKAVATWDKAYKQCQRGGAEIASPTTKELRDKMQSLIDGDTMYFTGIRASYDSDLFVSIEGVPFDDTPVTDLIEQLDSEDGRCVTMNSRKLSVVPCSSRLPYMCYKKQTKKYQTTCGTKCGTYDQEYKYVNSTGNCYKVHSNYTTWLDAYATCIAEDGYLAIINDADEASVLARDILISKEKFVWIGLVDWEANDKWQSVHGHAFNELYQEWDSANVRCNTTTRCATVNPYNGKLHDLGDCLTTGLTVPFLCEKEPAGYEIEAYDNTVIGDEVVT